MITKEEINTFIDAIKRRIKYLEDNVPDNVYLYELKLLLSDNISRNGDVHIRSSLLNKNAHLFFANCAHYLYKYTKDHLNN